MMASAGSRAMLWPERPVSEARRGGLSAELAHTTWPVRPVSEANNSGSDTAAALRAPAFSRSAAGSGDAGDGGRHG